jgi:hypothetical protein
MTPAEQFLDSLTRLNWWIVPKLGLLFLVFLYLIFGFLILRQIQLMAKVISGTSNTILKVLAGLGLIFSFFVFLLALIIL